MQSKSSLNWLVPIIVFLAIITAGTGLFASGSGEPFTFTTIHGQTVEMYGRGIYKNDPLLVGAGFRGTDAVTLLAALPLLLVAYHSARRGMQNGLILLIGILLFFLYNGASLTFSAAFNPLFLVYTALFCASLYATIVALATFDQQALVKRVRPGFPHRSIAIFTFVAGTGTFFIWMSDVIPALISGIAPITLGPYTTLYTHGLDSSVIIDS